MKQVLGQLPKAPPDENLVERQSPKSDKTDARRNREHPPSGLPTKNLVSRSIPQPDQEREDMARQRKHLKKERKKECKRERKKEVEHERELETLEEGVAELRKQR